MISSSSQLANASELVELETGRVDSMPLLPVHGRNPSLATARPTRRAQSSIASTNNMDEPFFISEHMRSHTLTSPFHPLEHEPSTSLSHLLSQRHVNNSLPDEIRIEEWLTHCAPPEIKIEKFRADKSWTISRKQFDGLWKRYQDYDRRVERLESILQFSLTSLQKLQDALVGISDDHLNKVHSPTTRSSPQLDTEGLSTLNVERFTRLCTQSTVLEDTIKKVGDQLPQTCVQRYRTFSKLQKILLGPEVLQRGKWGAPVFLPNGRLDGEAMKAAQDKANADREVLVQLEEKKQADVAVRTAHIGAIVGAVGLGITYPTVFNAQRGVIDFMTLSSVCFALALVFCALFQVLAFDNIPGLRSPLKSLIWLLLFLGAITFSFPLATLSDETTSNNGLNIAMFVILLCVTSIVPMIPLLATPKSEQSRRRYVVIYQIAWVGGFVLVLRGISPRVTGIDISR